MTMTTAEDGADDGRTDDGGKQGRENKMFRWPVRKTRVWHVVHAFRQVWGPEVVEECPLLGKGPAYLSCPHGSHALTPGPRNANVMWTNPFKVSFPAKNEHKNRNLDYLTV